MLAVLSHVLAIDDGSVLVRPAVGRIPFAVERVHAVRARARVEIVATGATNEYVVTCEAEELVVSTLALDPVRTLGSLEDVVPARSRYIPRKCGKRNDSQC